MSDEVGDGSGVVEWCLTQWWGLVESSSKAASKSATSSKSTPAFVRMFWLRCLVCFVGFRFVWFCGFGLTLAFLLLLFPLQLFCWFCFEILIGTLYFVIRLLVCLLGYLHVW